MNITVMGSGGWGTALALLLFGNGHEVTLWSHSPEKARALAQARENPLLPGVRLPEGLRVTNETDGLRRAAVVVFATPSFAVRETARLAAPHLAENALPVSASKGIERGTHWRMSEIIEAETGRAAAVLSGPSHAEEVARALPAGCVAASRSRETAEFVQRAFMNDVFRVYTHDDVTGVELAGALKNVVALCCGIGDGCGFGDNAKALLMTRSLTEMSRLAEKLGGRRDTMAGLAGVGDLIVTCTSMHSRNRRAGILIGQGLCAEEAMRKVGAVVEGYYAAQSVKELSEALGVEMPVCGAVYEILMHGADVRETVRALMRRLPKRESESDWVTAER